MTLDYISTSSPEGEIDLKVLADIITVEHSIDIGQIYFLIGEMTALL